MIPPFVNAGAGAPGDANGHAVYAIDLDALRRRVPLAPNTPKPKLVFSREGVADGHGLAVLDDEPIAYAADRAQNDVSVVDTRSARLLGSFALAGDLSTDPAPDLLFDSPDGRHLFVTLRGPVPLTGGPTATGATPGLGVIRLSKNGTSGKLVAIAPARRSDDRTPDPHGIGLRVVR